MSNAPGVPVGQTGPYPRNYAPDLLVPIARAENRARLGLGAKLPFHGVDTWNAYELSWLDDGGKPTAAVGEFVVPAESPRLVESKSLKLYLNSLNQTRFATLANVQQTIQTDLAAAAGSDVLVTLCPVVDLDVAPLDTLPGICLDALDLAISDYDVNPRLLRTTLNGGVRAEALYTHLFKSNCPVTGQPDWASVLVRYRGPAMDHGGLLEYLVSYRNCTAFHEDCVERIFVDLQRHCRPEALTVYARYNRRGGLDINPFRSDFEEPLENLRLARQ
jgi:7-cyano-7-deazaguanine reductase